MKYPKIETLFKRKPDYTVDTDKFRRPAFQAIDRWHVTEKIDGMNVRVVLMEDSISFGGRTDKAVLPIPLFLHLMDVFPFAKLRRMFTYEGGEDKPEVILYGEGYGGKIQKGGRYRETPSFRLFDIKVGAWWLDFFNVHEIAAAFDVKPAPVLGTYHTSDIIEMVRAGVISVVANEEMGIKARELAPDVIAEGVVARPLVTLFDKGGRRVMWKLKTRDFVPGKR